MTLVHSNTAPYDVMKVREDFPILSTRPYGKPLAYLDNAASAQKPRQVIERVTHAYEHEYANVHRGLHYLANAATDAYESAREKVRAYLNAGSTEEIIFTRGATEALNLVAASYGRAHIGPGDEIEDTQGSVSVITLLMKFVGGSSDAEAPAPVE